MSSSKLIARRALERTLANATVYLEAFGHVVPAWMWLEQALAMRDEWF